MPHTKPLPNLFAHESPVQWLPDPFPEPVPIRLAIKRDDQLHPLVSGNKWRKLKYNLLAAQQQQHTTLLTFGGAYSNHLYATAAAGQALGFRTIGVVRGDELASRPRNATLAFCESAGMHLHFVSRTDYVRKETPAFMADLVHRFGRFYALPEGGSNELAVQGTAEIMPELLAQLGTVPDYVACPVGTGGTLAGLAATSPPTTRVLGFGVLNGVGQLPLVAGLPHRQPGGVWDVFEYALGGYARTPDFLLPFIRDVERQTGVRLEQVYTGKMLYGIYDLARQGYFEPGATVVAIHTGGLQGRSATLK